MSEFVRIDIDDSRLQAGLKHLASAASDMTPAMRKIAATLESVVEENFEAEGRPRWTPSGRAKSEAGVTLQKSGRLAASVTTDHNANTVVIGSNVVYARIHQLGGKTSPHVIRPRAKKALAFGGRVLASVNHPGSDIPARPFLPVTSDGALQPEATDAVLGTILRHLKAAAGV
ncbi:phage virion morphogenesis protein [Pandoraea communis]|uniref:Phage virion morphogenesis protein n=1 Tax=Pandoraea communis TaxID=2508297 RepID=A0A5E4UGB0_9BURK|nr:phage virion morphogenesis protein [Pandoraea communis]VVD97904.1 phage virion morphogenesis protein [Pandoraea communis]